MGVPGGGDVSWVDGAVITLAVVAVIVVVILGMLDP